MGATAEQVRAEEREARELERHMERMRREAQRARERERQEAQRAQRRSLREELAAAEREAALRCRNYGRALTAYANASERREAQLGRELDVAFRWAMHATGRVSELREALGLSYRPEPIRGEL